MTTMKATRHEMLKEQWRVIIRGFNESGLTVRQWCEENQISPAKYYYWLRVIREESLVQAGTLAVTGQAHFAELKPSTELPPSMCSGACAIFRSNGIELEILNGADSNTLEVILKALGRL